MIVATTMLTISVGIVINSIAMTIVINISSRFIYSTICVWISLLKFGTTLVDRNTIISTI